MDYASIPEHLRFAAFKLWERAQYERESVSSEGRLCSANTASGEVVYASRAKDVAYRQGCVERAESCEKAIDLLRMASAQQAS